MPLLTRREIARLRLANQLVAPAASRAPRDVVRALGAMQAQEYSSSLWAVGSRSGATRAAVEESLNQGQIVRTWLFRGTIHLVAAEDAHWMAALVEPRLLKGAAKRQRDHGLDTATFAKAEKILTRALEGGRQMLREDALALLEANGISTAGGRSYHLIWTLALRRVLCLSSRQGSLQSVALMSEWVRKPRALSGDEALEELARRYFASHGPATIEDFAWWAAIPLTAARKAHAGIQRSLESCRFEDATYWMPPISSASAKRSLGNHLLAGFDHHLLGYEDRSAVLDAKHSAKVATSNGIFRAIMVTDGQITGTWKPAAGRASRDLPYEPFARTSARELKQAFAAAEKAYRQFLGR